MSSARLIRSSRLGQTVVVHVDGRLQQGVTPPPSAPEDVAETEEAANIVGAAQERASELFRAAADEVEELRVAGFERGRAEGYAEGVGIARAELAETLALVQAAALEGKAMRDALVHSAEGELIEVVIAALATILGEQARVDRTLVLGSVERALARSVSQNVVRVRVHPDDVELVATELRERGGPPASWQVLADGRVEVGGCLLDTTTGEVDARLDAQLDEVAQALRAAVPGA